MRIGIVAPSSAVGQVELANGADHLHGLGLDIVIHPQCSRQHYTFAGTDAERAQAFHDFASDQSIDAIWAAGGGYGATRLLPLLENLSEEFGTPPQKLLIGYSDITVLHEYVRSRWNWASLHCPMPSASNFADIDSQHLAAAVQYINRRKPEDPWGARLLRFLINAPATPLPGVLAGGNLSLWAALAGTPFAPIPVPGRILFFEDIGEAPYRIDRMATQLLQSGTFHGAAAIVLGDFTDCKDDPAQVLAPPAAAGETARNNKVPLRPRIQTAEALLETFGAIGDRLGIPVAAGLPVGHGPNFAPLPLGAQYVLTPDGRLQLARWSWLRASSA
jgi:muramoyltetrapeptide carboxypeptidase